jgi:hypothetical protein
MFVNFNLVGGDSFGSYLLKRVIVDAFSLTGAVEMHYSYSSVGSNELQAQFEYGPFAIFGDALPHYHEEACRTARSEALARGRHQVFGSPNAQSIERSALFGNPRTSEDLIPSDPEGGNTDRSQ